WLRRRAGLAHAKCALVFELIDKATLADPLALAARLKALPLRLRAPRPVAEAISTAGGVRLEALDDGLMVRDRPGVFCAGEMLDWEAPTGGYLLTACFASGVVAARGAVRWLRK
ncbi:MAG: NAD(P)/FAD-dependent oxidoreductase, partial [Rhodanobacter sp.]|nr:NAD(P)/FAD-dependent oxidoreductase [Rhodanobacter sp.]